MFRNCYCADDYDNVTTVARELCSIPCPGNPDEHCGGYRTLSRLARRQATVPSDALLAIYINAAAVLASSNTLTTTQISTSTLVSMAAANPTVTDPALISITTALVTSVVTATSTAFSTVCTSGYCNPAGYIFEVCPHAPAIGAIIFVIEPCSCRGGWSYVPANCTGGGCAGQTVYTCVPYSGTTGNDSVVVCHHQPCDHCSGGVTFVEAPPASIAPVIPTGPTASVVVAGADKFTAYLSSLTLVAGAFAFLF